MAISELRSNVYKTNRLSMAFHLRLGFQITRENAKGVEFFATVTDLAADPFIKRVAKKLRLSTPLPAPGRRLFAVHDPSMTSRLTRSAQRNLAPE